MLPGVDHALAAVDLVARYDGRRVLHGVTLPVARGQVTVLMGPSGAGKTTCVRHLVGLSTPAEGRALIDGRDIQELTDDELREQQRRMSVMLQGTTLFGGGLGWSLTVFENVAYPLRARTRLAEAELALRVRRRLAQVGLEERADLPLSDLSAGMVQRVSLARALVSNSEIVVLDSPETGVDGVRINAVIDGIRSAHLETGATFLVATHHEQLARAIGDTLAIIRAGRIVAYGRVDDVLRDESGFAARFVRGDPASGLGMTDVLEGAIAPLPELVEPSSRRVNLLIVLATIAVVAIVVALVAALVILRGPNVPPGP